MQIQTRAADVDRQRLRGGDCAYQRGADRLVEQRRQRARQHPPHRSARSIEHRRVGTDNASVAGLEKHDLLRASFLFFREQRRATVAVAYVYRSFPALAAMRGALIGGRLGRPVELVAVGGQHFPTYRPAYRQTYYADRATGGGAIQDALTHVLNLGEWLLGPIDRVVADAAHQLLPDVEVEDTVHLLARHGDVPAGEKISFDKVLAVGGDGDATLGLPLVKGASVAAEVLGPEKGEKLVIQKMRRRKNFRRKTGERHIYTRVRVGKISV